MNNEREKILSNLAAEDLIGRSLELDALLRHARGESKTNALLISSAPSVGVSELLRQTYDRLFYEQGESIPFYFALKKSDRTAHQAATRFLQSFLQQVVAFRRRESKILDAACDVCELSEIALPSDGYWIDRLIETCQTESKLNNELAFVKNCLSAPLRALANGARVFVMIDDLHKAEHFAGEIDFIEEINEIFSRFEMPFVFGGRRRFSFGASGANDFESLDIKPLSFVDAGLLAENLAVRYGVRINEQTRDLIAVQFDGNPLFIKSLMQSASEKKSALDSFQKVEQLYADEIFGGKIGKYYDAGFDEIAPRTETQKHLLSLLFDDLSVEHEKTHIETWQSRMNLADAEFSRVMRLLNTNEIVRLTSNLVETMRENLVLSDYVKGRFRLEIVLQNRALTVGETLSEFLKRAPRLMADFYRKNSAIGLRALLGVFDCQEIPVSLLDYSRFKDELKGAPNAEILKKLKNEPEKITLPQIIYTAHTVSFYAQFAQVVEKERSAVALGFIKSNYTDDDETVWIAAEIDSKLEAKKELAEFWCDRLEMVALMCNFSNYKIWLVAPEGFAPDAVEVLQSRSAFGSSKKQVELLVEFLGAKDALGEKLKANEYEMVVPMGEDTELIAAQTVEEIAKRHHFAPRAINQIKTALVEACINATEHSHSPDRKIYQKFTVENDRIIITISNRGLRLADKKAQEIAPGQDRRGWGLKLMKNLMDEVKFEQTDDGTRISMTKYLKK
ncbi:MAG TPA: ATP-binding protein [Pyrinomonadaceae bacterium]|nr:ATP-binding protein [Pyrinomonadaceae bacterium]